MTRLGVSIRPSRAGSSPAKAISVRTAASASSREGRAICGATALISSHRGALRKGLMSASMTVSPFDRSHSSGPGVSPGRPHRPSRRHGELTLYAGRTPHSQFRGPLITSLYRAYITRIRLQQRARLACARRTSSPCASPYIMLARRGAIAGNRPETPLPEAMINDVYNKRIIELAGNIPRLGRLSHAQASATAHSKLCGSTVTVDLKMEGDEVTDFAHEVKACALGQASSSIMARNVIGAKAQELRNLRETVRRMLKENGAPPDGKWADIAVLEPVRDYKARHASTLLTFDAVVDAVTQIEAKRRAAVAAE